MSITISNVNSWNGSELINPFGEPYAQVYLNRLEFDQDIKVKDFTWKIKQKAGSSNLIVKPVNLVAIDETAVIGNL